ncbi:MAG: hypothetical protein WDN07_01515 [Actinomycetota bacterium]
MTESKNPMHEQEFLSEDQKRSEEIMLKIRLATGLARQELTLEEQEVIKGFENEGYLQTEKWNNGSVVLKRDRSIDCRSNRARNTLVVDLADYARTPTRNSPSNRG